MQDLRSFLALLSEFPDEFVTAAGPVSARLELTRAVYALERKKRNSAVLFTQVDGFAMPVLANVFGTRRRLALSLGAEERDLHQAYRDREANLLKPVLVGAGPIQEVEESRVDLGTLPIVTHNGGDNGPYISAGIMTVKDPETGIRNSGIYRLMAKDARRTGIHLAESSHAYFIYRKYMERKQPMPVAITIGAHPACYLGSLSFLGFGADEFEAMGGLLGEPLEIVRCRTVDLEVPAAGEICLEGFIDWRTREPEGPVGEWHTLYSDIRDYPVVTITAITRRKEPIYLDICSGGAEHQLLGGLPRLGQIYRSVKKACPGVRDVFMPPSGFCRASCYVSLKKYVEGEPANAAAAVFGTDPFVRHVVVVDQDVDIFDDAEVLKALNLNTDLSKCFVMPYAKGSPIDPTSRNGVVSKIGVDATRPLGKEMSKVDYAEGVDMIDLSKIFGADAFRSG